ESAHADEARARDHDGEQAPGEASRVSHVPSQRLGLGVCPGNGDELAAATIVTRTASWGARSARALLAARPGRFNLGACGAGLDARPQSPIIGAHAPRPRDRDGGRAGRPPAAAHALAE